MFKLMQNKNSNNMQTAEENKVKIIVENCAVCLVNVFIT